jgi:hypothetical protein
MVQEEGDIHMPKINLTEDWLATIVGLLLVAVIGLGALGPGAQSVALSADAGATTSAALRPLAGWSLSAKLGGNAVTLADAPTAFVAGQVVVITCRDGALSLSPDVPDGVPAPPEGRAQVMLVNACDTGVTLTFTTRALIPWPMFNWFR